MEEIHTTIRGGGGGNEFPKSKVINVAFLHVRAMRNWKCFIDVELDLVGDVDLKCPANYFLDNKSFLQLYFWIQIQL